MNEAVRNFYNNFAEKLIFQKEINHARYQFVGEMAANMLKPQHTVLDLGCGIGTTSVIMSAYCQEVVAVDFAPKLLQLAERRENIVYHCGDIIGICFGRTFDFICLFDVLEHIEPAHIPGVFNAIRTHMSDETELLIIIPYWKYLDYKKTHYPETIQIVDSCISLDDLSLWAQQASLEILHYEVLTLFHVSDYTYVQMKRDIQYDPKNNN